MSSKGSPSIRVFTSPALRATVDVAFEGVPGIRFVSSIGSELDALGAFEPGPIVGRGDDDLAALVYTGGTTGASKGVMLTHANLWEAGRFGQATSYVPGLNRSLTCLPLSHSYGLLVLATGFHGPESPESVLMRWFDAETWLDLAVEHKSQIAALVPSMIYRLLAQPLEERDLSELRQVVSGAAPLSLAAFEEFRRRVPGAELREGYGLTETSALCTSNRPGAGKPGTVGQPVEGTEIRILDDDGAEVAQGEPGEVCVRSELVMAGYWGAPELSAATMTDGFLRTGDIGKLDDDGYLSIIDRKKDLIVRGGFNVFPRDVEEVLLEHPAVASACVVGRPDQLHGEEVVAFVSLADGSEASSDELVAFAKERLAGYKYPREIRVLSSMPLTVVGKADRKVLRELAAKQGVDT